ncbi:F-box domain-containing protein [Mycena sanguinolenta]|uniref:F-box domain-containing protein n=1 Tax=Mycena sanguinolenta TaxID=230812 RepID=A0A8H6XSV2_9AGAR|nr:F-box domain-containing protein [Mycena sanguinolenta]
MDLWIQSLRADSRSIHDARLNSSRPSSESSPAAVTRKSSAATVKPRRVVAPRPNAKKHANASTGSLGNGAVVDSQDPEKCLNLCRDTLMQPQTRKFGQMRCDAMAELRTKYYIDPSEVARVMDEISEAQVLYASYEKECARLKCILTAPNPNEAPLGPTKSNLCIHPCCYPSFYSPSRASPEWRRLRRIIQLLQLRCRDLSQYLSAKRYLSAPIRRLPLELLQEVFLFAVISDTFAVYASSGATFPKAVGAIRLAHVCSYWRTAALNTGQLWATILLRLPPYDRSGITQFNFHVSHAKLAPLTILSYGWAEWRMLRRLARLSHRWRTVRLMIDSEADFKELDAVRHRISLLKSLNIYMCEHVNRRTINAFEDAPSLRRVTFTVSQNSIWPFRFILPWR